MPNSTSNYNLTKPLETEFYDISVQNGNMDKVDAQMKANADAAALAATKKVPSAIGNLAALDESGNLADSGKKASEFADATHGHAYSDISDKPSSFDPSAHASQHATNGADRILPSAIGAATPYHGTATLAVASWVGSAAPFVYTIAVPDMTDDDNTGVGVAYSADEAANAVLDKAWQAAKPRIESVAGQLKIIARGTKPTVAIPIFYRGSR